MFHTFCIHLAHRLSFRKIVKEGQKLNVENFGGAMYRVGVLCTPTAYGIFWAFRPSEVISGAFQSTYTISLSIPVATASVERCHLAIIVNCVLSFQLHSIVNPDCSRLGLIKTSLMTKETSWHG